MAQAVFEDHPLGEYLRGVGELDDVMPGTSAQMEMEICPSGNVNPIAEEDLVDPLAEWRPRLLIQFIDTLQSIQSARPPNPFVERFKYDIISSSLLSPTLQTPHHRSVRTPPIPGRLSHSRSNSVETHIDTPHPPPTASTPQGPSYFTPSLAIAAVAVFCLTGHVSLALFSAAAVAAALHVMHVMNDSSKLDMTACLTSLNELITASDTWESIVREAISNIEAEEQSSFYSSTFSASSPSSSIRVALHSSLLTTQTQCDNVRQLFSALTSAIELSQLSEMYAPTSPSKSLSFELSQRPLSLPTSQNMSPLSLPLDAKRNKRSTWNGSYTGLIDYVSPLPPLLRRRNKRRPDLTSVLRSSQTSENLGGASSSSCNGQSSIREEIIVEGEVMATLMEAQSSQGESFGTAALALHKSRQEEGVEAFRPLSASATRMSWMPSTVSPGARLSSLQSSRHPLCLPALQTAIQGALSSKRYACSHLLALRFQEDEDEGYWEDVRSVMALLTSTLSDASSRLMQAFEDHEKSALQDYGPLTPLSETDDSPRGTCHIHISPPSGVNRRSQDLTSFAPMPGPFARFAAHVAAISSALEDAKEHLEGCISSFNNDSRDSHNVASTSGRRWSAIPIPAEGSFDANYEHPALQAYERLRRELGLALRECERGRERLLEIVKPAPDPAANDSDSEEVPGLGHDMSDDSDKHGPNSLSDGEEGEMTMNRAVLAALLDGKIDDDSGNDDATDHLLLSTSPQHLPPALGVEQVFEAESGAVAGFTRERSKLSREERIKLMKVRRESIATTSRHHGPVLELRVNGDREGREKWGPGGEVVQELKDVIWKVGEKRRKFADGTRRQSVDLTIPVGGNSDVRVRQLEDESVGRTIDNIDMVAEMPVSCPSSTTLDGHIAQPLKNAT
ncbi:hypothetical protein AX17_005933 [Amanita inopinata Kibby_2008]|nr:hypothetical protein AX17_005933 [Amanita inopinata Kibby_2008]